jgi:creatinine amidohydrolase
MAVHALATMTWTEVRELPAARTVAILPTGAIEAHGPHLPLGTDIVIAEAMARAGAARIDARGFEVLVLPALPVAPAPFAAAFPGTIHTPAEATTMMVAGIARSLAEHGIRVTAIANAHHDPAHVDALRAAVASVAKDGRAVLVFPDLTRRRWAERLTEGYEGSVVLAERPDTVRTAVMERLAPNPHSLVEAMRGGHVTFADAGGANAYFGFPAEATAEEGRAIIESLGGILEEAVMDTVEGR